MKVEKKSLDDVLKELEKNKVPLKEPIRTNIFPLDLLFGNGINNEIIQIAGDSGTGKTLLSLQLAQIYCNKGKKVFYLSTQNSVNQDRLQQYGLVGFINSQFFMYNAQTFKTAEEILDKFIATDEIDLVIVDSIANIVNDGYLNINHQGKSKGISIDNYNSNYDSRPLSLFIRKYSALASNKHFTLVLVSSMRQKIGKIGTIEKRFGPKALDGSCSTIIKINKPKSTRFYKLYENVNLGTALEIEVIKSNTMKPNSKIPFYLAYDYGIDDIYNLVYYLVAVNVITQNGTYYQYGTDIKTKGISSMINELSKFRDQYMNYYRKSMEDYYKSI